MAPISSTYNDITILDGYTDEPACLGVPPFIAPLPRYIYGAIKHAIIDANINYLTIDEFRRIIHNEKQDNKNKLKWMAKAQLLIVIAGAIVPGKYLRGTPISIREILEIGKKYQSINIIGGAAVRFGFRSGNYARHNTSIDRIKDTYDHVVKKDLDASIYDHLIDHQFTDRLRTLKELQEWSKIGVEVVKQHPDYPAPLLVELEAGRGCVRYFSGGCSFCSEPGYGAVNFRPPEDIIEEVRLLDGLGVQHYRLGALSDIFSYNAKDLGDTETPKPNPESVNRLLAGIRSTAKGLKVLHLDNANPAVMAANIKETTEIIKIILKNCTGGNVLSFGLESADPNVIKVNNLNTNPKEVEEMIKLLNNYGANQSSTGMPELLPGLNFVLGLKGETKETFNLNLEFLKSLVDQDLIIRRINLRQVLNSSETPLKKFRKKRYHQTFIQFKNLVREEIDQVILKRMIPFGTIIKDVFIEMHSGNISFGRQLGTYPILIGVKYQLPLDTYQDIVICEHGFRSLSGFSTPFYINRFPKHAFKALPGLGMKRAVRLIRNRPFKNIKGVKEALDDDKLMNDIEEHLNYDP
jgi:radical SAM superfamily enzyme with C-terminal helix-hairpin-helix motif